MPEPPTPQRSLRRHFQNWISWAGMVLAASAFFAFAFLFAIDQFSSRQNAYGGILSYVLAPGFLLLGIALIFLGAFLHWRAEPRKTATHAVLRIDFSRPRDRRVIFAFVACSVGFLFLTALGSYETYHYTESVEFCGKACHLPMEPEFVASQRMAHANVECVACHVGPGAGAYFKTKLNGVKQLYHTVAGDFERPIFVTEVNPRPPQAICEQCHWPQRYVGNVERTTSIIFRMRKTRLLPCVSSSMSAEVTRRTALSAAFIGT